jgi:hypothetical protein
MLWEFNRFLPEKPCQTGSLAKRLLLMLIDVQLLAAIHVILPPAPSVFQESSDAGVYTRGSVRRASGFVLTSKPELKWSKADLDEAALRRTHSRVVS